MKKIAVKTLQPGLTFSEPVYIEGNNILVPAGVPIRKKDIDRLTTWGIDTVETEGAALAVVANPDKKKSAPASAEAAPAADADGAESSAGEEQWAEPEGGAPADSAPAAKKKSNASMLSLTEVQENTGAYRSYVDLIERLDSVFSNISGGVSIEARSIDDITSRLLQAVRDQRNSIIGYILGGEVTGHEMAKSSVNAAILSALIAQELKLPSHKIMQIITGALLHDVGMLRLPKEIIDKRGGLSEAELQRMQAHPL
jgi:HD-GYP domain-containing protein (c-di-GMP phosphodiesterase class II)